MKRTTYQGAALNEISFPLGGIGTGSVGLAGNGRLIDWEIFNAPSKGSDNGYTHFAVRTEKDGRVIDARILTGDVTKEYMGQYGRNVGLGMPNTTMAGFPHFRDCVFTGEYPIAEVALDDPDFPGSARLTAFNPLIPLNAKDSGIPAAFVSFAITNTTSDTLSYLFAATLRNPRNHSVNTFVKESGMSALFLSNTDNTGENFEHCDLTLATDETENVCAQEYWYRGSWFDGVETYWRNFTEQSTPAPRHYDVPGNGDCATLYVKKTAKPGETVVFRTVLAWNCPNRRNYWDKYCKKNEAGEDVEIPMKNYYATVFENSMASARYAVKERERLWTETKRYHDVLFASTVPEEVLDAASATTSVLKTETCLRIGENGDFYGWEGLHQSSGSCEGTCTHVWNYAYAMCYLFPELERNIRENDYHYNQRPAGDMCFRTRIPFGRGTGSFRACADGQLGGIMKVYREWKLSGNTEWLASLWEPVKKSLVFAWSEENFDRWDRDRDGVLEGRQHHTLDMELFGPSSWLEGFYLGALKAAEEMAEALGDTAFADECAALFARGYRWSDENLFNGSYFVQKTDLTDKAMLESYDRENGGRSLLGGSAMDAYWNAEAGEIKYQIGGGCALDQLLAQWHADLMGLGDLFDPEKVHTALGNMYKNNFKESMRRHYNTFRLFAVNDEAGAVICDYPEGAEKPAIPIPYAQESMHGFEYAFAGLLISRGYLDEGLRIVKGVRDRYDGEKRNPWNEIECGNNYARSMASYALLPILSGMQADMTRGYLGFAPKINRENFACVWSVGGAWGQVRMTENAMELEVIGGTLTVGEIGLPFAGEVSSVTVRGNDTAFCVKNGHVVLDTPAVLSAGVIRLTK